MQVKDALGSLEADEQERLSCGFTKGRWRRRL